MVRLGHRPGPRLREPATDHVADPEDRRVEPDARPVERVDLARTLTARDDSGDDQTEQSQQEDVELGRLVGVLRLVAARAASQRLRESAAHHVAHGEDRDVEPDSSGVEVVDSPTGDDQSDDETDEREELGRLRRVLGLVERLALTVFAFAHRPRLVVLSGRHVRSSGRWCPQFIGAIWPIARTERCCP